MKTAKEMKDNCKYPTTVNSIINNRTNFLSQVNSRLKIIDETKETKKIVRRSEFISLEIPVIQKRILELIEIDEIGRNFQMIYSPSPIYLSVLSHVEIREILENELEGFFVDDGRESFSYRICLLKDSSFQGKRKKNNKYSLEA